MTPDTKKLISVGVGSSKNLWTLADRPQDLIVEFTDRISVFDYGALPESFPHRAEALKTISVIFFDLLKSHQIKTAYVEDLGGRYIKMCRARHAKFVSATDSALELEFIPLEVIFRYGVPAGSSLLKRRRDLKAGDRFEVPLIEFSTKMESQDRILSEEEASLHFSDLDSLRTLTKKISKLLKEYCESCGLELWDGKFEFAVDKNGDCVLVDAITPDELRLSVKGMDSVPLSKELLRHWLSQTTWAAHLRLAKEHYGSEWKKNISSPPRLGEWRVQKVSTLYKAIAECLKNRSPDTLLHWMRSDLFSPKVCVIGSGGREAALRWRLEKEGCVTCDDPFKADAVWVSMDADLEKGLVNDFDSRGLWTLGPTREASQVEWSKHFGRQVAQRAKIPIPRFEVGSENLEKFVDPPVVKLDGLAAGKGVIVPASMPEARQAVETFSKRGPVLLEERLHGFEASAFFYVESGSRGVRTQLLGTAKDFKRRLPNDEGPNTGGMGAYVPHPDISEEDEMLFHQWAQKTAEGLDQEGKPFRGVLYLGLMKDEKKGWHLIEYNARLGDPETQALVVSWEQSFHLRSLLQLCVSTKDMDFSATQPSLCLALVRPEYPEAPKVAALDLPKWDPDCHLFLAQSRSGRVAYLVSQADTLIEAGDKIFEVLVESPWRHLLEWRPDILR